VNVTLTLTVPLAVVSESIAADIRDDLIAMINEHEAVIDGIQSSIEHGWPEEGAD